MTGGILALGRVTPPGPFLAVLALLALALPVAFLFRLEPLPRAVLLAGTAAGFRAAFGRLVDYEPIAFVGLLALETAYYAAPPFLLNLVVLLFGQRVREPLRVEAVHVYLPLLVVVPVVAGTLIYQKLTDVERLGPSLRLVAAIYGLCYAGIFLVVVWTRMGAAGAPESGHDATARAADLESTGRFGMAARYYAHEGNLAKAAEMAERAGEWERAAELRRRIGDHLNAAEMYARAERWDEAAEAYGRAGHHAAAALVCERRGWLDRAAAAFERAGDPASAVRVLEGARRQPSAELYEKAGLHAKAAAVHLAHGSWQRAAEILECNLGDVDGAARLCLEAAAFTEAGRLFEKAKKIDEAIEAYLKSPATAFEALRLCLEGDDLERAGRIAATLSPEAEAKAAEDEKTALILARIHYQGGRLDDAIRLLQRLKRRSASGGGVYLLLGVCFRDKGLPDLAEQELSTAVTLPLDPREDMEARYELGRVLEVLGRPGPALDIYRDIMKQQFDYRDVEQRYRQLSNSAAPS